MSEFAFHPAGREALDAEATELLKRVVEIPRERRGSRTTPFHPDAESALTLTDKEILGPLDMESVNPFMGTVSVIALDTRDGVVGFVDEGCSYFERLVHNTLRASGLKQFVSGSFVRGLLKDWVRASVEGRVASGFASLVEEEVRESVSKLEVWVPVAGLNVEEAFELGRVSLRALDRRFFDRWQTRRESTTPAEHLDQVTQHFARLRREFQGMAAAVITVTAEANHAVNIALEEIERVTSALRIYHPATIAPRVCSYCQPYGREQHLAYTAFVGSENSIEMELAGLLEADPVPWKIDAEELRRLRRLNLDDLHALLRANPRTPFQEQLLASLLIYSRNATAKTPIEKLIFVLVGLESLLLRSESETIQQTVGERLAFALFEGAAERQQAVELTKRCYGYRSRFLHHGRDEHELDQLADFMFLAWRLFLSAIRQHRRFSSKDALLAALDRIKYS